MATITTYKCDRKQLCGYLKKIFIKSGEKEVIKYNDYLTKELNKKRISFDRIQELTDQQATVKWWVSNVMKKYNRDDLRREKVKRENDKTNKLVAYFAGEVIKGTLALADIKSESLREMTKECLEDTPFYVSDSETEKSVIADTVRENEITIKAEENITKEEPAAEVVNPLEAFTSEYVDELLRKYNASYSIAYKGNYNDFNGSNSNSELLSDSRKFKKYISDTIKAEIPGLKFDLACSFRHWYSKKITVTLKVNKADFFKSYADLQKDDSAFSAFEVMRWNLCENNYYNYGGWTSYSAEIGQLIYEKYFMNQNHGIAQLQKTAKDYYMQVIRFIDELIKSYSYDHSDIQSDYFSSGLDHDIKVEIIDKNTEEAEHFKEVFNNAKANDETAILEQYPDYVLSDEVKNAIEEARIQRQKAFEEEQKQREIEKQEQEKAHKLWLAKYEECKKHYSIEGVEDLEHTILYNCTFSHWNKANNLKDVEEFKIKGGLEGGKYGTQAQICKIVDFDSDDAYEFFTNNLLADWDFCNCGGCGHVDLETLKDLDYNECYHMTQEEQDARGIVWVRECVLIRLNGVNKLVVDPEGFSYCRYVGTVEKATVMKPKAEAFDSSAWLSSEDLQLLEECKQSLKFGDSFQIYDFGTQRPKNPNFWEKLGELGKVTKNNMCWGVSRV